MTTLRRWEVKAHCPQCGEWMQPAVYLCETVIQMGSQELTDITPGMDGGGSSYRCNGCDIKHDTRTLTFELVQEETP